MTDAPDRIALTGLTVRGNHGVFDFEKREGQDFVIDVVLHTSVAAAAATDDIDDTIHYGYLAEDVAHIVEDNTFDLIETLADRIAEHCLTLCGHVEVTVHKPSAPIERTFSDVSVSVERRAEAISASVCSDETEAVLSLGANLGEPRDTITQALEALDRHPRIAVRARSSFWRTAPWGDVAQNDFLNVTALVSTSLTPAELLGVCQGIEVACGRTRELRWGPRTLDIDVIQVRCAGAEVTASSTSLDLPHPRASVRAFVLAPWAEVEPAATLTTRDGVVRVSDLLTEAADQEISLAPGPQPR